MKFLCNYGKLLFTDLYEITMSAVYFYEFKDTWGIFELWVRNLPEKRGYLVFCGLEFAVNYLLNLHFTEEEIEFLKKHPSLSHIGDQFFEYLSGLKFTGNLYAMPEGTVFFENEPVLRIEAPIVEAQIVETALLNSKSVVAILFFPNRVFLFMSQLIKSIDLPAFLGIYFHTVTNMNLIISFSVQPNH